MTASHSPTVDPVWRQDNGASDRSWLDHSGPVDRALADTWLAEADEKHRESRLSLEGESQRSRGAVPGISVIVPSHQGRKHIERCLRSLAGQTLDHELFEIIVVLNGQPDGTTAIIDQFRQSHPSVTVRVIRLNRTGASRARNAGIAAAVREYITFVDDDDYVSASFLEVLLAYARPGVVPVASVVDVHPNGHNPDNRINQLLRERAGKLTAPRDIPVATTFNAGKVVATELVREIPYDLALANGEDVLFWTSVVVRRHLDFYPCPPSDGATYYRVVRKDSVSRPAPTFDFAVTQRLDVITRLEQLRREADARTIGLVNDRMRAQTGFINDYLLRETADHGRVVEALDRYPIFHMPYDRMNNGLSRGLAIAYAFPPYADTSAVVTAKRIRDKGDVVDVVYNRMDAIRETDDSLRRISGPFVGDGAGLPTPSYFSDWGSMERFSVEGLKVIRRWEAVKGPYEWLYSRAQFAASHFLAAAYKLSNLAVAWSAEFSDPLSRDIHDRERGTPVKDGDFLRGLRRGMKDLGLPLPESPNCFVWCEELAYALAEELIFTNENQMEYMLGYCSNPELAAMARKKAVVAPHPTLPPVFYSMVDCRYRLEAGVVHLAYFGNFYETRGLDDVLAAVARQDQWTRAHVRVHVFTTKSAQLERRAAELGISELLRVNPYVRYLEFLNLTTKFDCLIVNDAATAASHRCNPYLPSKWSDYRGSGISVWGVVESDSPLSHQPLEFVSPVGDIDAAAEVLSLIVHKKLAVHEKLPGRP